MHELNGRTLVNRTYNVDVGKGKSGKDDNYRFSEDLCSRRSSSV
jgi:hypothetical protein